MRAEVDSSSGTRSRPISRSDMRPVATGPLESDGHADDDQSEWARQEQQVRLLRLPLRKVCLRLTPPEDDDTPTRRDD